MKLDIVITTYNRPFKVLGLVKEITQANKNINEIIIVDSSEVENKLLKNISKVRYITSNHKNQPYQRFLGYLSSKSELILFLDDDMEIANNNFVEIIKAKFDKPKVVGLVINFVNKHNNTGLSEVPGSKIFKRKTYLKRIVNWITGYPELLEGKLGLCGVRGKQPFEGGATEWLSGGAFAARRTSLFKNFNFQLFDLFEEKIGMGEDVIIGYSLNKEGQLFYDPEVLFFHNDQKDSTYTSNLKNFAKRVTFSRLYLSLEKGRYDNRILFLIKVHYHWYTLWRILGLFFNYLMYPTKVRENLLLGALLGWKLSCFFQYSSDFEKNKFWENEAQKIIF